MALDESALKDSAASSSYTRVLPSSMVPSSVPAKVDDERQRLIRVVEDLNNGLTTEATLPDGLLSVSLFQHQKIALAWMLEKENSLACCGGILADDQVTSFNSTSYSEEYKSSYINVSLSQGLGKTVSVIALIQMQKSLSKPKPLIVDEDNQVSSSRAAQEFHKRKPAGGGTLVVCPASVLQQWAHELDEKVADEAKLQVLIYHGGKRTKDPDELAKYDVVITTYSIVAKEVPTRTFAEYDDDDDESEFGNKRKKRRKKGIEGSTVAKVHWLRVILDEAQTITDDCDCNTQFANSCCGLRAKKRWCLSGKPIQNSVNEVFSYFRFLKFEPYSEYTSYCNQIMISIFRREEEGYMKLEAVLQEIMLRRTKYTWIDGKPIIDLLPTQAISFSTEERAFYLKIEAESRARFKAYLDAGTVRQNYRNILSMLLHLHQACGHPLLVKGFTLNSCCMSDDDDERCLFFQNNDYYISSKIRKSVEIIRSHCRSNDLQCQVPIKAVIFSQWTRMLDLVEASLNHLCIKYRRHDGSMSLVSRNRAVKEFNSDPQVNIMLMSLKAGKIGLNIVAASHIILLDNWWNPGTEDEVIERAYRIGQIYPVTVWRITIEDTIDDRIIELQEEKRRLHPSVFGKDRISAPRLTVQDLRYLFMGTP